MSYFLFSRSDIDYTEEMDVFISDKKGGSLTMLVIREIVEDRPLRMDLPWVRGQGYLGGREK